MKNKSRLKTTFYSLVIIFIILLPFFLIPIPRSIKLPLIAILGLAFLIQGIRLTLIARKEKGKLKLFLMLTGISAIAPLIFAILHNLFYGLTITFENLKYLFEPLQVTFFILAIIIAPIIFIVGVVGSIIFFNGITDKKGTAAK
jgi:uncharacterized membrane protein